MLFSSAFKLGSLERVDFLVADILRGQLTAVAYSWWYGSSYEKVLLVIAC